jgi:hypothetical protein
MVNKTFPPATGDPERVFVLTALRATFWKSILKQNYGPISLEMTGRLVLEAVIKKEVIPKMLFYNYVHLPHITNMTSLSGILESADEGIKRQMEQFDSPLH